MPRRPAENEVRVFKVRSDPDAGGALCSVLKVPRERHHGVRRGREEAPRPLERRDTPDGKQRQRAILPILGAGRSEAPNAGWIVPSGLEARGAGGSCSDSVRGQALPPPLSRVPVSRAWARRLCETEGLCPHPPWQQSRVQVDPEDDGEGEGEGREVADLV